jgi:hypothetical protein
VELAALSDERDSYLLLYLFSINDFGECHSHSKLEKVQDSVLPLQQLRRQQDG